MQFELAPYEGALPLRFDMRRGEVWAALGASPEPNAGGQVEEWFIEVFESLTVNYDAGGAAAEFCFDPADEKATLNFRGAVLLGPGAVADPLLVLGQHDPEPEI